MDRIELGKKIRKARNEAGLSMIELAAKAGISINTLHRVETGKSKANKTTIRSIMNELGVTVEDIEG